MCMRSSTFYSVTWVWHSATAKLEVICLSCCCSVAKPCLTLGSPMDCSLPGFPVIHYLPHARLPCHSLSISQSFLRLMSIESTMPSNQLIIEIGEKQAQKFYSFLLEELPQFRVVEIKLNSWVRNEVVFYCWLCWNNSPHNDTQQRETKIPKSISTSCPLILKALHCVKPRAVLWYPHKRAKWI